jgi:hypothetical protein
VRASQVGLQATQHLQLVALPPETTRTQQATRVEAFRFVEVHSPTVVESPLAEALEQAAAEVVAARRTRYLYPNNRFERGSRRKRGSKVCRESTAIARLDDWQATWPAFMRQSLQSSCLKLPPSSRALRLLSASCCRVD